MEAKIVGDIFKLQLRTKLNGKVMQDTGLNDLICDVPVLVTYVSSFMELRVGDVIATGTPSGIGGARKPPIFLTDGDEIVIEVPGVGTLHNTIVTG